MANTIAQDKKESAQEDASSREDQLLDQLLDQYMAPPEDLSQRILARCHEAAEEDAFLREAEATMVRRPRFGFWRVAALAACLCLGCYLGVVWATNRAQDSASPVLQLAKALTGAPVALETPFTAETPAVAAVAAEDDAVAMNDASPVLMKAAPRPAQSTEAVVPSGELATADPRGFSFRDEQSLRKQAAFRAPSQDVRTVSTQGGETVNASRRKRLAPMESEVTQVWVAPEMLSQEKLQAFLEKHPATTAGSATPDENGVLTFTILAMDTEIQQLVDTLFSQLHWKLLSPNSPQPGEFLNTPIAGEPVKYTIKLVQGK
jgi:hypothetical protein